MDDSFTMEKGLYAFGAFVLFAIAMGLLTSALDLSFPVASASGGVLAIVAVEVLFIALCCWGIYRFVRKLNRVAPAAKAKPVKKRARAKKK